jgi:hypothetical protein
MPIRPRPRDIQGPGQRALVGRPVGGVRRAPVPVQVPADQRRPAPVRTLDAVGHHEMGVQQRVTRAAGAVVEPDRQHAVPTNMLRPTVTTPGAKVPIKVGDRPGQPGVVGGQHRPPVAASPRPYSSETLLVGRNTTSKAGTALRPCARPSSSPVSGWQPSKIRPNASVLASPDWPRLVAP